MALPVQDKRLETDVEKLDTDVNAADADLKAIIQTLNLPEAGLTGSQMIATAITESFKSLFELMQPAPVVRFKIGPVTDQAAGFTRAE